MCTHVVGIYTTYVIKTEGLHMLYNSLTVPGGSDGSSGVLVCCENYIVYKNLGDQTNIRCPIPCRQVSIILQLCM